MPKIQPYSTRVQTPGAVDVPRANPETMGAAIGRGVEKLGAAVSGFGDQLQKAKEQDELSELNKQMALAKRDFTLDLQERVKSGEIGTDENGEYTLTNEFKEKMSGRMGEIGGRVTTRRGQLAFEESSTSTMASFTVEAVQAESQLVGIKARKDYETSFNARSSRVLTSPSAFEDALNENIKDIDDRVATGQLDYKSAEDLKARGNKVLSKAYIEGWAKLDARRPDRERPNRGHQLLQDGAVDQFLDSETKNELFSKINAEERAARVEENLLKQQEKEAKKEADMDFMDKIYTDIVKGKTGGKTREILDSDLDWNKKKQMIDILEHQATKKTVTNNALFNDLFKRIHLDPTDPRKIYDGQLGQYIDQIKFEDINKLRREARGLNTEAGRQEAEFKKGFFATARAKLIKSENGAKDPDGEASMQRLTSQFFTIYEEEKAKGKSPRALLTPGSPDYIGDSLINAYAKTPMEKVRAQIQNMNRPSQTPAPTGTPSPTPFRRKDGESMSDFLLRRKAGGA